MNQLQYETSPYLLQHADNPVHWYAWNAESLALAKTEDKPILLSIGYSTCHWCHVMERESFHDTDIAAFMNAHFINIKVDREERPDLDALYLAACEQISGSAGWPLNVFLTPDLKPFYAGTYFPVQPGHKRISWIQVLQFALYNYREQREVVERQADRILARINADPGPAGKDNDTPDDGLSVAIFNQLQTHFDRENGGFGTGQKFPNTMALEFLLNYFYYTREPEALRHLRFTLSTMLRSGIYDHIGGGIARYTVDREWRVPHFEKMLYDNAQFAQLLARAYRLIGRRKYKTALTQTLNFLERELQSPEGMFYAALDADSEAGEGRYYTWTKAEVEAVLGDTAATFCTYFGITDPGNWEGTNILYQPQDRFQLADYLGRDRETLLESMHAARRKMLEARARRMSLHRDEKIILGWNAMMVSTYVQAYQATGATAYEKSARRLLGILNREFVHPNGLDYFRVRTGEQLAHAATLRDYAFLIRAQLDVFQLSNDQADLERAVVLTNHIRKHFLENGTDLFRHARLDLPDLIQHRPDLIDEDMPSGNALMLRNLQDLAILTDTTTYRKQAEAMLRQMTAGVKARPLAHASWANGMLAAEKGILEIAVAGPDALSWKQTIERGGYLPFSVLVATGLADENLPLLIGKKTEAETLIYVCRQYSCMAPIGDPAVFAEEYFRPPDLSVKK